MSAKTEDGDRKRHVAKSLAKDASAPRAIPATAAIRWILRESAAASAPGALLGDLCDKLVLEGLPISSALLTVTSLDPMVARTRIRWQREDGGRVTSEVLFHGMTLEAGSSNAECIRFTFPGTDHEIEWRAEETRSFDPEQRAYLEAVGVAMAAPLQAVIGRGVTRGLLQAYLGRRSAEKVLNGSVRRGVGELIDAVIWFRICGILRVFPKHCRTIRSSLH